VNLVLDRSCNKNSKTTPLKRGYPNGATIAKENRKNGLNSAKLKLEA